MIFKLAFGFGAANLAKFFWFAGWFGMEVWILFPTLSLTVFCRRERLQKVCVNLPVWVEIDRHNPKNK